MLNLSLKELRLIAENRGIKGIDKLLSILDVLESIKKTKNNSDVNKIVEDIEIPFESKNKTIRDI